MNIQQYNSFNKFDKGPVCVPDPNEVLDLKNLNSVGEIIKNSGIISGTNKLDDIDIANVVNWYNLYKTAYSYPEKEHKLSKKWEGIFEDINKQKGKSDIMGLVEIAIGRLLQNEFEKKGYNVRVRKTTNFDDITSRIDYIVESFNKKNKITNVIGIDFTISERGADSLYKNLKKESFPKDYKVYYEKKYGKKLHKVPRVVMTLERDLAYSFTNNFFVTVMEEGHLLDSENIEENFQYAIADLKHKVNISKKTFSVSKTVEDTNSHVNTLLSKF